MGLGVGTKGLPGDVNGVQVNYPQGLMFLRHVGYTETSQITAARCLPSPSTCFILFFYPLVSV